MEIPNLKAWSDVIASGTHDNFVVLGDEESQEEIYDLASKFANKFPNRRALWVRNSDILGEELSKLKGNNEAVLAVTIAPSQKIVKRFTAADFPAESISNAVAGAFGDSLAEGHEIDLYWCSAGHHTSICPCPKHPGASCGPS